MKRHTLTQTQTSSDVTAIFIAHDALNLVLEDVQWDPAHLQISIDVISGGWRNYTIATSMPAIEMEITMQFTLNRYEKSGRTDLRYWELAHEGILVMVTFAGYRYEHKLVGRENRKLEHAWQTEANKLRFKSAVAAKKK